jgi:hypothetical protein
MQKIQNKKFKRLKLLTEEFELPVALEELALYVMSEEQPVDDIVKIIDNERDKVNETVKNILNEVKEIISCGIKIQSVKFDYCDSLNLTHGVAYFKVILQGSKQALRKIAKTDWPFTQKSE